MTDLDEGALLDALRSVLDEDEALADDVAELVARDAFAMRRLDAELAELVYDTALEAPAGVRGDDGGRQVAFRAGGRELEVEVHDDGTMVGRVAPPATTVAIEVPGRSADVEMDRLGRFTVGAAGPRVRFALGGAGLPAVVTPWIFR